MIVVNGSTGYDSPEPLWIVTKVCNVASLMVFFALRTAILSLSIPVIEHLIFLASVSSVSGKDPHPICRTVSSVLI